jgi:hypothetical protein
MYRLVHNVNCKEKGSSLHARGESTVTEHTGNTQRAHVQPAVADVCGKTRAGKSGTPTQSQAADLPFVHFLSRTGMSRSQIDSPPSTQGLSFGTLRKTL